MSSVRAEYPLPRTACNALRATGTPAISAPQTSASRNLARRLAAIRSSFATTGPSTNRICRRPRTGRDEVRAAGGAASRSRPRRFAISSIAASAATGTRLAPARTPAVLKRPCRRAPPRSSIRACTGFPLRQDGWNWDGCRAVGRPRRSRGDRNRRNSRGTWTGGNPWLPPVMPSRRQRRREDSSRRAANHTIRVADVCGRRATRWCPQPPESPTTDERRRAETDEPERFDAEAGHERNERDRAHDLLCETCPMSGVRHDPATRREAAGVARPQGGPAIRLWSVGPMVANVNAHIEPLWVAHPRFQSRGLLCYASRQVISSGRSYRLSSPSFAHRDRPARCDRRAFCVPSRSGTAARQNG